MDDVSISVSMLTLIKELNESVHFANREKKHNSSKNKKQFSGFERWKYSAGASYSGF